jgi:FixJ family two-component response regulator
MEESQLVNRDESSSIHIPRSSVRADVAVIDDDASIRRSLIRSIRAAGYEVEAFASAEDFLGSPMLALVSCAVCDVRLAGISGLQLQQILHGRVPFLSMIFVTGYGDIPATVTAMKSGAIHFLEKPVSRTVLLEAIACAVERTKKARAAMAAIGQLKNRYGRLTPREREVFALLSAGLLNKQVAAQLACAEKTVKQHRGIIMRKMQADSFADLVVIAERIGVRPTDANLAWAKGRLYPGFVDSQSLEPPVRNVYSSVPGAFRRD